MAQNHAGAMRLGGQAKERQLLQGAVFPVAKQTWPAKSHLRRRRFSAHRHLPHAQGRNHSPGPRLRLFRPASSRNQGEAVGKPDRQAWLRSHLAAHRQGGLKCKKERRKNQCLNVLFLFSEAIAVGTLISERPPHRSVRAAFPHTAPTSGVDGELAVCAPAPVTRLPGTEPGTCYAVPHSLWPPPLAPPAPQRIALPCSPASQLLRRGLTSHARASSATAPHLPDAGLGGRRVHRPNVRPPRFRRLPFVRDVFFDHGRASVPRIAGPHMLPSTLLTGSASAVLWLSRLNSTPHTIAVYASHPPSPATTQHSLPGARYGLPGPVSHRQDHASFAWRTSNPSYGRKSWIASSLRSSQ